VLFNLTMMMPKFQYLRTVLFVIGTLVSLSKSFSSVVTTTLRRQTTPTTTTTRLFENLDDLRNNLESSWNVESMGQIPNNPQAAAEEAASSIRQARIDGLGNMCFVDLFLPQYDIAQGDNMYDEVEAVEYCTFLSKYLDTQAVIYVRDQISLRRVSRVLGNREKKRLRKEIENDGGAIEEMYEYDEVSMIIDEDDPDWDKYPDEDVVEGNNDSSSSSDSSSMQSDFYDDFAEVGSVDDSFFTTSSPSSSSPPQVDDKLVSSFRDQLSSVWQGDNEESNQQPPKGNKRTKVIKKLIRREIDEDASMTAQLAAQMNYRIASLFGDSKISNGGEITSDVVKAVKKHGLPKEEEETMIILSTNSDAEMLAVRALVSKYKNNKNLIFVNCRLDPLPLELDSCSTVYHLTPMVAVTTVDPRNVFNSKVSEEKETPIKVVSIRRYPGDWEVYVDADGNGFELAQKASASKFPKKGPGNEWIASAVKTYFESRQ